MNPVRDQPGKGSPLICFLWSAIWALRSSAYQSRPPPSGNQTVRIARDAVDGPRLELRCPPVRARSSPRTTPRRRQSPVNPSSSTVWVPESRPVWLDWNFMGLSHACDLSRHRKQTEPTLGVGLLCFPGWSGGPTGGLVVAGGRLMMDASLWDETIAELSADHRCVAPTLPLGADLSLPGGCDRSAPLTLHTGRLRRITIFNDSGPWRRGRSRGSSHECGR
jgi:hypothetical protein